ncbi:MAG: cytochrome P450 [Caldilinea sp.]|nr:cytochrome P450 [Caldilinea sp.]MDW8439059.1 cytochrome P450 [Caldilineaceae bacterium]
MTMHEALPVHSQFTRPVNFSGHWLWGAAPAFNADPIGALMAAARMGRIVRLRFFNASAYLLREPEDVKHVLVDNHRAYHKGYGLQALKPILGEGLLTSEPPLHTRQRRMIQPAFHRQRIAAYADIITRSAEDHLATWQDGARLDLHEELMRLTMVIVARCLFDVDVSREAAQVGRAITDLIQMFDFNRIGPLGQLIDRLDLRKQRERNRRLQVLDDLIYTMIRTRRAEGIDHGDLLSTIVLAQDEEAPSIADRHMSERLARDEVLTLFIAGHETTAIALTWTFYLLAQYPEVEAKLHAEVDALLGDPRHPRRRLSWHDLPALEYTRRVFAEAMRLYPPAWATGRLAVANDEIGGVSIEKGASVLISPYVTHRLEHLWPEPERFEPDRFAPEEEHLRPKFAYFPFGGGPRRCIGEPFAWMEGQLLLAAIAHRYQLQVAPGYVAELDPQITLRPRHGMPVILKQRNKARVPEG